MTEPTLAGTIANQDAESISQTAVAALLDEVVTHPKPGLVDPVDNRGHEDMDVYLFIDSAVSLQPYLAQCFQTGMTFIGTALPALMERLRPLGMTAERRMFTVTNNVNTHKGAIFGLGIMVAACGYAQAQSAGTEVQLAAISTTVRGMTAGLVQTDFADLQHKQHLTAGERQYLQYGTTGIRGEAEAGFPTVFQHGLPAFLTSSGSRQERILTALLAIVANSRDSNLIKRAGTPAIVSKVQTQAQEMLHVKHTTGRLDWNALQQMTEQFAAQRLSLGGSADLLILTILMARLMQRF
ncbi:triphosphoribosyl-dephospho-CoA synthase CitG [Fructilactobacillus myrtifloralis]|uniref:Probable 2-(5''-triphosphoribosyl)-3'-dephosphocoenzyme-A synthase n=1 Tax=Fructilactobacillus myrtifloralis TaxID=2940301 RepID=A0ABY5BND7_9LACO|nr:triphosphoribosyl-dephospho-CoA synthase CitG [Fructilactobacillus myrtifloralis]USS84622.1 triphosphoribosyl-dephospho-CoA synthase CitG [Fructilactobacillus myrtifloralis]